MNQTSNQMEIRKYLGLNDNEHTTYQYFWDLAKAVFRKKFMNTYFRKKKTSNK